MQKTRNSGELKSILVPGAVVVYRIEEHNVTAPECDNTRQLEERHARVFAPIWFQ